MTIVNTLPFRITTFAGPNDNLSHDEELGFARFVKVKQVWQAAGSGAPIRIRITAVRAGPGVDGKADYEVIGKGRTGTVRTDRLLDGRAGFELVRIKRKVATAPTT